MWPSWYSNFRPLELQPDTQHSELCSPASENAQKLRLVWKFTTKSTLFICRVGQSFGLGRDLMGRGGTSQVDTKDDWINVVNYLPFFWEDNHYVFVNAFPHMKYRLKMWSTLKEKNLLSGCTRPLFRRRAKQFWQICLLWNFIQSLETKSS